MPPLRAQRHGEGTGRNDGPLMNRCQPFRARRYGAAVMAVPTVTKLWLPEVMAMGPRARMVCS